MRNSILIVAAALAISAGVAQASIIHYTGAQGDNLALYNVAPTASATAGTNQSGWGSSGYKGAIDGDTGTFWHGWNTGNPPGTKAWWEMTWSGGAQTFNRIALTSDTDLASGEHGSAGTIGNFSLYVDGNNSTPLAFANDATIASGNGTFDLKNSITASTIRIQWFTVRTGGHHAIINEFEVYNVIPEPATTAVLGLGGLAMLLTRRRNRRA